MDVRRLALLKFCFLCFCLLVNAFTDITSSVFGKRVINGTIAAFGDFNSDKFTDMFFITDGGHTVEVVLADQKNDKRQIYCKFKQHLITNVVPGDYNGDLLMDLLVMLRENNQDKENEILEYRILWGNHTTLDCNTNSAAENKTMRGQPLVLDYNGDMIPDLYGESIDGQRTVWIQNSDKIADILNITNAKHPIRNPHSSAFLDLNGDKFADIFVTTTNEKHSENFFEVWYNEDGSYPGPSEEKMFKISNEYVIGQSTFLDIDLDGKLEHIVPVCSKRNCSNSTIYLLRGDQMIALSSGFFEDGEWGFYHDDSFPITLHIGDFNLDGYPDLLAVLYQEKGQRRAFLLENNPCHGCQYSRHFNWSFSSLKNIENVVLATFYDIHQDGNLDIIIVSYNSSTSTYKVSALENEIERDVCFMKVLVVSGLFSGDFSSSSRKIFYGSNQPGPFIKYTTTQLDGSPQTGCAAQLAQSAHYALQLPYTVFGLGQTPNFVDELEISIPRSKHKKNPIRSWPSIIPNSQMIVIPLQEEATTKIRWNYLLFVTPANKFQVLLTVIALIGTCVLVLLIVGSLHWVEKIADKKEKLQEAQRFHFDAM